MDPITKMQAKLALYAYPDPYREMWAMDMPYIPSAQELVMLSAH